MFWNTITKLILKNKLAWLVLLGLCTAFMGYMASKVETSYEFAKLMPETDSVSIEYNILVDEFGQVGTIVIFGANRIALLDALAGLTFVHDLGTVAFADFHRLALLDVVEFHSPTPLF